MYLHYFTGRYSIRVYPTFLQLHGKTYDYKIPHTTVLRLFLLPHQDNRFMFFVVQYSFFSQKGICIKNLFHILRTQI